MSSKRILDNSEGREVFQFLESELPKSKEAKFAIGYFYISGFKLVDSHFPSDIETTPFLKMVMGSETDQDTGIQIISGYERREKIKQEILEELQDPEISEEQKQNIDSLAELIVKEKIEIRLFENSKLHAKLYLFLNNSESEFASQGTALIGSSNFTYAGLTKNRELNTVVTDSEQIDYLNSWYDSLWQEASEFHKDLLKLIQISGIRKTEKAKKEYPELGKFISPDELFKYLIYKWFDGKVMNMSKKDVLSEFQMVGVLNTIRMIDYYNGAIVADSVGLGKSFIAMAIIEEFINGKHRDWILKEEGVPSVLMIVPPSVLNQWEELIIGEIDNTNNEYNYLKAGQLIQINNSHFFKNKQIIAEGELKDNDKSFKIYDDTGEILLGKIRLFSIGLFQSNPDTNKKLDKFRDEFDLIMVDEAHKFKNRNSNRWRSLSKLHKKPNNKINKMLLLSATPMSNSIYELKNLIELFNDETFQPFVLKGINVNELFRSYQILFQQSKEDDSEEIKKQVRDKALELKRKVIDEVVLLRTRSYIKQNFSNVTINDKSLVFKDPQVHSLDYSSYIQKVFSEFSDFLIQELNNLEFEHTKLYGAINVIFGDSSGEKANPGATIRIADIFRLLLGKRLESSVYAFEVTLRKVLYKEKSSHVYFTNYIHKVKTKKELQTFLESLLENTKIKSNFELSEEEREDFLSDDAKWFQSVWSLWEIYAEEYKVQKNKNDFLTIEKLIEFASFRVIQNLENDITLIEKILEKLDALKEKDEKGEPVILDDLPKDNRDGIDSNFPIWSYLYDPKLNALKQILGSASEQSKSLKAPNLSEKKTVLFSQYKDTTYYLHRALENWSKKTIYVKEVYFDIQNKNRSRIGLVTGDTDSMSRINLKKRFSPKANNGFEEIKKSGELKLLIATDAFSEGVNLQDGEAIINYDLPWNPMLIVQRVGRINRIGSENDVDVLNFVPSEELQVLVSVLSKLKSKIQIITHVMGKDSKILDPNEEISVETFGQKIKNLSEISIDDLEEMGISDELKSGFSAKDKLQTEEFQLLNEIQFRLNYSGKDFEKFQEEKYQNKVFYSFIPGSDRLYSIYEFQRGKEGERKTLEKKIFSTSMQNSNGTKEESPLILLNLVKDNKKVGPVKIIEIAEVLNQFQSKTEEIKKEIEDATVIKQRGFFNRLSDFLGRHAIFKQNDPLWRDKLPEVFNKLNILKPQEHVPKIRSLLEEAKILQEKSGKVGLKDPDKAVEILYEYLKDKTVINYEQNIINYGWFYERQN